MQQCRHSLHLSASEGQGMIPWTPKRPVISSHKTQERQGPRSLYLLKKAKAYNHD